VPTRLAALVALLGAAAASLQGTSAEATAASAPTAGAAPAAAEAAASDDPPSELHAADLGVVINMDDQLSKAIGDYYVRKRKIPSTNIARVHFDASRDELPLAQFTAIKAAVEAQIGARVQAYALTWVRPYRVTCMSITSAFAFGVDSKYCASGCSPTKLNPYFNAPSSRPYDDLHIRPTMAVAAHDFVTAKRLIDRGVESDAAFPQGSAYLVTTNDSARNARTAQYAQAAAESRINVELVQGAEIKGRTDVLFYFIGATTVPDLDSNRFVPGAIADHLTSFGGMLTDSSQMSSLRWIEAGATGSYGTVVEPCAFPAKFADIRVLVRRYLAGETLIESYWKSVAMPGQGIFIGEPLAAPFRARPQS
jgi:uncharacterized protein (TIGR03790 family)